MRQPPLAKAGLRYQRACEHAPLTVLNIYLQGRAVYAKQNLARCMASTARLCKAKQSGAGQSGAWKCKAKQG